MNDQPTNQRTDLRGHIEGTLFHPINILILKPAWYGFPSVVVRQWLLLLSLALKGEKKYNISLTYRLSHNPCPMDFNELFGQGILCTLYNFSQKRNNTVLITCTYVIDSEWLLMPPWHVKLCVLFILCLYMLEDLCNRPLSSLNITLPPSHSHNKWRTQLQHLLWPCVYLVLGSSWS